MTHHDTNPVSGALPHRSGALALLVVMGLTTVVLVGLNWDQLVGQRPTPHPVVTATPAAPGLPSPPAVGDIELTVPGDEPKVMRYAVAAENLPTYALVLQQTMTVIQDGHTAQAVTSIGASVTIEPAPEPGKVYFAFTGFDLSIASNGTPVELPAVDSLLDGIRLLVELDPQFGLGDDSTLAGVNPQVRRLLTVLVDAIRQAYPVLPEQAVGSNGTWTRVVSWSDEGETQLTTSLREEHRLQRDADYTSIHRTSQIELGGDPELGTLSGQGKGTLEATLLPTTGILEQSNGAFAFEQTIESGDTQWVQQFGLKFSLSRTQ